MGRRPPRSTVRWGLSSVLLVGATACEETRPRPDPLSVTSMPRAHHGPRRLLLGKLVRLGSLTVEATLSDDVASETLSDDGKRALIVERSGRLRAVSLWPIVRQLWTLYPTTTCDTPRVGANFLACVHGTSVTWFDDYGRTSELASVSPIVEADVSDPWLVTRSREGRVTVFDGATGQVHATAVFTTPACMQTAKPCLVARQDGGVCAAGERTDPREDPRIDVMCHDFDLKLRWTKTIRPRDRVRLGVVQRGPHAAMLSSLDCTPSKHAHSEQGFSVAWRDGATTEFQDETKVPWDSPSGPAAVNPCWTRLLAADAEKLYLQSLPDFGSSTPLLTARPRDSWEDTWTLERPSREVIHRVEVVGDHLLVVSRPAPNAPLRAEILDAVTGTLLDSHTQAAP